MAETFSFIPDRGFRKQSKARVNVANFGDGYSQRYSAGINIFEESWDLSFRNRTISDINSIVSFLETHRGSTYFNWTPPGETVAIKAVCSEWNVEYNSEFSKSLSCTFNRVYDLT